MLDKCLDSIVRTIALFLGTILGIFAIYIMYWPVTFSMTLIILIIFMITKGC
jgi:hypothetical protein